MEGRGALGLVRNSHGTPGLGLRVGLPGRLFCESKGGSAENFVTPSSVFLRHDFKYSILSKTVFLHSDKSCMACSKR